jgi:ATP-binding cassette subfamily D (ALD) long-chain fatty acid import protein
MAHAVSLLWPSYFGILKEIFKDPESFRRTFTTFSRRYRSSLAGLLLVAIATLVTAKRFYTKLKQKKRPGLSQRQSSAVILKDGWSREIYVPNNGKLSRVVISPTKPITFQAHRRLFFDPIANNNHKQIGVNKKFLHQFSAIWAILVPRFRSKASMLLLIHTLFLFARTYLSLVIAKLDGRIVRDLIAANGTGFVKGLVYWLLIAIPASYTNSIIKFLQSKVSLEFRTRLVRYIHDIYLDDTLNFYKVSNIDGGIEGIDQYITADLIKFCDAAASLYSNLGKPAVDFMIFSYQLRRNLGPLAIVGIFSNYFATAWLLKAMAPSFGLLTSVEGRLEGEYRNAHSKLITNAEEIAFYDGTSLERSILIKTYARLASHIRAILRIKVSYIMFEDFIIKYSWSALGYLFSSLPVFLPNWSGDDAKTEMEPSLKSANKDFRERDRMKQFITNKRLMLSLADAGSRMMYSIKDLSELAGYTARVYSMLATLHRVHANAYGNKNPQVRARKQHKVKLYSLEDVQGTMHEGFDGIRFEHTPIVVPGLGRDLSAGELLVKDLNIRIDPGEHLLISGSNGTGKSAVARVLGGLWPVFRGLVSKPLNKDISFLPQRPYLSNGSLREQIIYPSSEVEMYEAGKTDADLLEILRMVRLEYLPDREGGWNTKKQWKDVFSGGEKQRVMFARILYKRPRFAVIDEGTSAVSSDVEGLLYETCQKLGITLVTISHRPSLLRYHKAQLRLGEGAHGDEWVLEKTGTDEARLSVEREIADLEEQLSKIDELKKRRTEIADLLLGKKAASK